LSSDIQKSNGPYLECGHVGTCFTTLRVLCQNKNVKYFNIIKRSGRIRKLALHEPLQLWSHTPHFFSLLQKKINSSGCQKWCTNDGFSAFDIISFLAMLTYWRRG
jgi:hypothetical protein